MSFSAQTRGPARGPTSNTMDYGLMKLPHTPYFISLMALAQRDLALEYKIQNTETLFHISTIYMIMSVTTKRVTK